MAVFDENGLIKLFKLFALPACLGVFKKSTLVHRMFNVNVSLWYRFQVFFCKSNFDSLFLVV